MAYSRQRRASEPDTSSTTGITGVSGVAILQFRWTDGLEWFEIDASGRGEREHGNVNIFAPQDALRTLAQSATSQFGPESFADAAELGLDRHGAVWWHYRSGFNGQHLHGTAFVCGASCRVSADTACLLIFNQIALV